MVAEEEEEDCRRVEIDRRRRRHVVFVRRRRKLVRRRIFVGVQSAADRGRFRKRIEAAGTSGGTEIVDGRSKRVKTRRRRVDENAGGDATGANVVKLV